MSSPSLRRRRAGAAVVAVATIAAGVPLLIGAANAADTPTRLAITQDDGRTTAAAGSCTALTVRPTDSIGAPVTGATVTVTLTEAAVSDTHDVDFCTVGGGTAPFLAPNYMNAGFDDGNPLPVMSTDRAPGKNEYDAGPSVTTAASDSPDRVPGSIVQGEAREDRPDVPQGTSGSSDPGANNTLNPTGVDRATFVSNEEGAVRIGVVGLLSGQRALVDAFVDNDADGVRDTTGDTTDTSTTNDPDTVQATQRSLALTAGGRPGSDAARDAVSRVVVAPDESFAAKASDEGQASHVFTVSLFNQSGDRVAGVAPRAVATAGPNAPTATSPGSFTESCGETLNQGQDATCSYNATQPGTDTVTVFVNQTTGAATFGLDATEPRDTATATSTRPSVGAGEAHTLVLTPPTASLQAGQSQVFTATVTDSTGAPAREVPLTFAEQGPGSLTSRATTSTSGTTSTTTATTDATGRAQVTFVTAPGDSGSTAVFAGITTPASTRCQAAATGTTAAGQCTDSSPVTITAASTPTATPTATTSAGPSPSASPSTSTAPPAARVAGRFNPVTPARLLDTRSNGGAVRAGADRTLDVTGVGGVPADGVSAVVLNVTVTQSTARGDLQVYPVGQRPLTRTSNLNYLRGQTVPVLVQTGVGEGGRVAFSVNTGSAQVVVDVFGWYGDASRLASEGSGYTALTPTRLLDTRTTGGALTAGGDRRIQVAGEAGVPADATAVVLNTTALGAPANADLQVYPFSDRPLQRTSNLNVSRGQTKANAVTTALDDDGAIGLSVSQNRIQVVLDVLGYYSPGSAGRFVPLAPQRILDTRDDRTPVVAGTDREVTVSGRAGVPSDATAAVLSVTATGASRSLDLQVFPTGDRPEQRTSTLNLTTGQAVANLAPATLGDDGQVSLSASQGSVSVILDVLGYFTD